MLLGLVRRAALNWQALVGPRRRYDFKSDSRTMRSPRSTTCPRDCPNTITLCSNCLLTDVPGNLFYAQVGRFVGWTELALQLGSQFAQLSTTRRWDPPEDTRMISVGFALPNPLTRTGLCAALTANRASFNLRPCAVCPEMTSAQVV